MINIDDNTVDATLNNSNGKETCHSEHDSQNDLCSTDLLPPLLKRDIKISNFLLLDRQSDDNSCTSQPIDDGLTGDGDNCFNTHEFTHEFRTKETKKKMIKMVYCILPIMLIIESLPTLIFVHLPLTQYFFEKNIELMCTISICIYFVSMNVLYRENVRKHTANSCIALTIQSACLGVILCHSTMRVKLEFITWALEFTIGIILAVTIFAEYFSIVTTKCEPFIVRIGLWILILFVLASIVFKTLYSHSELLEVFFGGVGCFLCTILLAFVTREITEDRKFVFPPGETNIALSMMLLVIVLTCSYICMVVNGLDEMRGFTYY